MNSVHIFAQFIQVQTLCSFCKVLKDCVDPVGHPAALHVFVCNLRVWHVSFRGLIYRQLHCKIRKSHSVTKAFYLLTNFSFSQHQTCSYAFFKPMNKQLFRTYIGKTVTYTVPWKQCAVDILHIVYSFFTGYCILWFHSILIFRILWLALALLSIKTEGKQSWLA